MGYCKKANHMITVHSKNNDKSVNYISSLKELFTKEINIDYDKLLGNNGGAIYDIKQYFSANRFLFAILTNMILFALFFVFFTPIFAINDDPAMMRIASGARTGEPSEYLIFINVIIGHFLKLFYTLFPQLNWYVIIFYLVHFISMVAVLYVFLRNAFSLKNILLFLLLFVFIETQFLTYLQFTTTAFVAGISGILLFLSFEDETKNSKWSGLAAGILLVVLAGLIRSSVVYALLMLWLPLCIYRAYITKSFYKIIPIVIAALFFFAASEYDTRYYEKQPDWSYYKEYNSLRSNLTDYQHFAYTEDTKEVYDAVGWSENNVNMFRNWSFADLEVFPLEDLAYIVSNIETPGRNFADILSTLYRAFSYLDSRGLWFIIAIVLTALITVNRQEKKYLLLALLVVSAASVYLAYSGRILPRAFFPLLYFLCCFAMFNLTLSYNNIFAKHSLKHVSRLFIYCSLAFIIFLIFSVEAGNSSINKLIGDRIDYNAEQLASRDYIYATWPSPGSFESFIMSRNYSLTLFNVHDTDHSRQINRLPFGGSFSHSPHNNKILADASIDNIYIDLVERNDILLIADRALIKYLLTQFMHENYGIKIQAVPIQITEYIIAYEVSELDTN